MTAQIEDAGASDRAFALLQELLPQQLLSRGMHRLARSTRPLLRNATLRAVLRAYPQIDLGEAAQPDPFAYPSFNAFFTRALRPGLRPIEGADGDLVSPVDGTLSQFGTVRDGQLLHAKGLHYTGGALLADETSKIQSERSGLRTIVDMAKLKVPFKFNCTVATRKRIRENPDEVRRFGAAMVEAIHYYKTHKEESIKIMHKYTRGVDRAILEAAHKGNSDILVDDAYPTLEGLKQTLEIQSLTDPRAAKAKAEDFVELRFVDELKKSGFVEKLQGRR